MVISVTGCSTLNSGAPKEQKIAGIVSTALKVAYSAGGSELVCQRIDSLVTDGKLTQEQGEQLKKAAQKAYDTLVADLDAVSDGGSVKSGSVANVIILAWEAGGRDMVAAKVDQLVKDGKITDVEAKAIMDAADKGYASVLEAIQEKETASK